MPVKKAGNGLAAGCQLFYRKIYGYFLQRTVVRQLNKGMHLTYFSSKAGCLKDFDKFHRYNDAITGKLISAAVSLIGKNLVLL